MKGFYLNPNLADAYVLVAYFNSNSRVHSGLGVNALHTIKVLRKHKIRADMVAIRSATELAAALDARNGEVTHCVIEAPFLSTASLSDLTLKYDLTTFIVRIHSQLGFLQVEAGAVKLIREQLILQESRTNFTISANSRRMTEFLRTAYAGNCLYLPNLYDLERVKRQKGRLHDHKLLRIGDFGAMRLLKNHLTAAGAALLIAQSRQADLEFWVSNNREEHGRGVLDAIRYLFQSVPYAKLVESPWQDWPDFRRTVANMDLCLQPSMTETFNLVSADAAAEGIPSAVSSSIEWCPDSWKVDIDSADDIARVGNQLLSDPNAALDGITSLKVYAHEAIHIWKAYLNDHPMSYQKKHPSLPDA